jgi:hypothetical protein
MADAAPEEAATVCWFEELPTELLHEILLELPARQWQCCRMLSRRWAAVVRDALAGMLSGVRGEHAAARLEAVRLFRYELGDGASRARPARTAGAPRG